MKLELKTDAETKAPVMDDQGRIIYLDTDDDGKEYPLDPVAMYGKIASLNTENRKHREKNEELVKLYEPFKGIEDLTEWKGKADKALETVANFNDKDWMKADKVDQLKREMAAAYEDKLKAKDQGIADMEVKHAGAIEKLNTTIRQLMVSSRFSASKYFGDAESNSVTILPPDIAESYFGKFFKVEAGDNGEPITRAYFSNGDPVLSKVNPGEPAEFEEAIGIIIDNHPTRDSIIRASGGGSGGAGGGGTGGEGGSDDYSTLQKQHAQAMKDGRAQDAIAIKNKMNEVAQKMRHTG